MFPCRVHMDCCGLQHENVLVRVVDFASFFIKKLQIHTGNSDRRIFTLVNQDLFGVKQRKYYYSEFLPKKDAKLPTLDSVATQKS